LIFWSTKKELTRVPGGKRPRLKCLNCSQEATFYECLVDENLKAYFVVEIWKTSKRVMQCGECLGVCDYYQVFPDEKAREEAAATAQKQEQAEAEAKRKQEQEEARKRQEETARKKYEEEQKLKDEALNDELQQLKRKLGK
jgi:Na+-translocating ferredoxin:NAD+ oxidoreductase RnfC subunit